MRRLLLVLILTSIGCVQPAFVFVAHAQTKTETRFGDALSKLDIDAVRAALKAEADPNERYGGKGLSALSRVVGTVMLPRYDDPPMPLDEAERKAIAILDVLFEAGAQLRSYDSTILHAAAIEGAKSLTEYLLDRGADPNGADSAGNTPVI